MEQNPYNPLDEFFQMFNIATGRELIEIREYLATERLAAVNAHDVAQVVVIKELSDRAQQLLERLRSDNSYNKDKRDNRVG
jgi:hypothetical protein